MIRKHNPLWKIRTAIREEKSDAFFRKGRKTSLYLKIRISKRILGIGSEYRAENHQTASQHEKTVAQIQNQLTSFFLVNETEIIDDKTMAESVCQVAGSTAGNESRRRFFCPAANRFFCLTEKFSVQRGLKKKDFSRILKSENF